MSKNKYVHGYTEKEFGRLYDQAGTLLELLHADTSYPAGSLILEAGCGVGAQTAILAEKCGGSKIISIDISADSLNKARKLIRDKGIDNVEFQAADIYNLSFPDNSFDHVFICFVLEHIENPKLALASARRVLKKGGSITVIEGDHGSCFFHPESAEALRAWQCLIDVQSRLGGDSLIGRRLYPLLSESGYREIAVSPRFVYADESKPKMVDGFTRKTIIQMVEGVRDNAISMGLIDADTWDRGIAGLHKTASHGGTFCYTFFKGTAVK